MPGVKIIVRNNDGDLIELARFLNRTGWEVVQRAEEGSVGISTIFMDDLDESIWTTLGLNDGARRQIRLVDIDTNRIVQFGYTARRSIKRRYDTYGSPVGRAWSIEIWDPNALINRRVFTHSGAKRPRETDVDRIQWLVETAPEWDIVGSNVIIGTGSTKTMSKSDYRGQMVGDLIRDCAQQANKNYWLDIVNDGAGDRLTFWYGKDNRDYYYSDLSISNDLADWDIAALNAGTTTDVYPPSIDTEYQMQPDRIFTGIYGRWEKGAVYRHSITGETQFERWDTVMDWPNIHQKDRAVERALNMLERLADAGEEVRIESAILVPAADAHRIRAGMRIPVKLTHIPTMTEYVDCRILSRGLSPRADGARYWIPLTLEPIEASPSTSCTTVLAGVQSAVESNAAYDGATVHISITPTAGHDYVIIGAAIASTGNTPSDSDFVASGSTTLMGQDNVPAGRPLYGGFYRCISAASGAYTLGGTYTVGFNTGSDSWGMTAVAFESSASAPVQDPKTNVGDNVTAATVTLDSPPTPGNMLIMIAGDRGGLWPFAGPPVHGWTLLSDATESDSGGDPTEHVAVYARCVQAGDPAGPWGFLDAETQTFVCVSEWAV